MAVELPGNNRSGFLDFAKEDAIKWPSSVSSGGMSVRVPATSLWAGAWSLELLQVVTPVSRTGGEPGSPVWVTVMSCTVAMHTGRRPKFKSGGENSRRWNNFEAASSRGVRWATSNGKRDVATSAESPRPPACCAGCDCCNGPGNCGVRGLARVGGGGGGGMCCARLDADGRGDSGVSTPGGGGGVRAGLSPPAPVEALFACIASIPFPRWWWWGECENCGAAAAGTTAAVKTPPTVPETNAVATHTTHTNSVERMNDIVPHETELWTPLKRMLCPPKDFVPESARCCCVKRHQLRTAVTWLRFVGQELLRPRQHKNNHVNVRTWRCKGTTYQPSTGTVRPCVACTQEPHTGCFVRELRQLKNHIRKFNLFT